MTYRGNPMRLYESSSRDRDSYQELSYSQYHLNQDDALYLYEEHSFQDESSQIHHYNTPYSRQGPSLLGCPPFPRRSLPYSSHDNPRGENLKTSHHNYSSAHQDRFQYPNQSNLLYSHSEKSGYSHQDNLLYSSQNNSHQDNLLYSSQGSSRRDKALYSQDNSLFPSQGNSRRSNLYEESLPYSGKNRSHRGNSSFLDQDNRGNSRQSSSASSSQDTLNQGSLSYHCQDNPSHLDNSLYSHQDNLSHSEHSPLLYREKSLYSFQEDSPYAPRRNLYSHQDKSIYSNQENLRDDLHRDSLLYSYRDTSPYSEEDNLKQSYPTNVSHLYESNSPSELHKDDSMDNYPQSEQKNSSYTYQSALRQHNSTISNEEHLFHLLDEISQQNDSSQNYSNQNDSSNLDKDKLTNSNSEFKIHSVEDITVMENKILKLRKELKKKKSFVSNMLQLFEDCCKKIDLNLIWKVQLSSEDESCNKLFHYVLLCNDICLGNAKGEQIEAARNEACSNAFTKLTKRYIKLVCDAKGQLEIVSSDISFDKIPSSEVKTVGPSDNIKNKDNFPVTSQFPKEISSAKNLEENRVGEPVIKETLTFSDGLIKIWTNNSEVLSEEAESDQYETTISHLYKHDSPENEATEFEGLTNKSPAYIEAKFLKLGRKLRMKKNEESDIFKVFDECCRNAGMKLMWWVKRTQNYFYYALRCAGIGIGGRKCSQSPQTARLDACQAAFKNIIKPYLKVTTNNDGSLEIVGSFIPKADKKSFNNSANYKRNDRSFTLEAWSPYN